MFCRSSAIHSTNCLSVPVSVCLSVCLCLFVSPGQVGAVWLLSHAMLLLLGNTSLFRSSWLSLAEMEVPTPLKTPL